MLSEAVLDKISIETIPSATSGTREVRHEDVLRGGLDAIERASLESQAALVIET